MNPPTRNSLAVAALACVLGALAYGIFSTHGGQPPVGESALNGASPLPPSQPQATGSVAPDVERVGVRGIEAAIPERTTEGLYRPPSEDALASLRIIVAIELKSFFEQMQLAETKAGESESAFAEFLQAELNYRMRQEVTKSLEHADALLVPKASRSQIYARPYMQYTTSEQVNNAQAVICVPVLETSSVVKDLQAATVNTRNSVLQSAVSAHNAKSDNDRLFARSAFEKGKGLPGISAGVDPWVSHRLKFVDGDYLHISR